MDERRPVALELLAQVAHVRLDDVRLAAEVVVPDVVEDLRLRQDAAGVQQEVPQQVELGGGQLDRLAVAADLVGRLVHLEVGEAEDAIVLLVTERPSEDDADAGDDLGQRERLRDVVVTADRQAGQLVVERVAGGEEEHRRPDAVGPEPPGDLEPVEVRQHHVEHDQVRRPVLGHGQGAAPGRRLVDVEPLVAQRRRDRVDDRRFVVDDQDAARWRIVGHRGHLLAGPGSHDRLPGRCGPAVGPL